jgi:hypothetical protein
MQRNTLSEKRKRYQTYTLLNYVLSPNSLFDYLSKDAFEAIMSTKIVADGCYNKEITPEQLFLYLITTKNVLKYEEVKNNFSIKNLRNVFLNLESPYTKTYLTKNIKRFEFSKDFIQLLENSSKNAENRFKSPVITINILFISLLEYLEIKYGKVFTKLLGNYLDMASLKSKVIKDIYMEEANISKQLKKEYLFFAYLLRINISELQFKRLIENSILVSVVPFFRNKLILRNLSENIMDLIEREISKSLKYAPIRKYLLKE